MGKDGVCFGPHARFSGFQKSQVVVAQIPLVCTIEPLLLVSRSDGLSI